MDQGGNRIMHRYALANYCCTGEGRQEAEVSDGQL